MGWIYGLVAKLFTKTIWHFSFTVIVKPNIIPVVVADGCAQVKVPDTNCCCGGVLLVAGTLKPAERDWERERQVCAGVTISQPTPPPATTLPRPLVKADFKHGRWARQFPCFTKTHRTESAWTSSLRRSEKLVEFVKLDWSKAYKHFSQPWAMDNLQMLLSFLGGFIGSMVTLQLSCFISPIIFSTRQWWAICQSFRGYKSWIAL